jgi:SSS family solute:Na+ symporter
MVVPALLAKYFPHGMLGIGLTALMASFMSGMAGNVTAFNTVWTYDLYQRWFKPDASDAHLMQVGRLTTVVGLLISAVCAYAATKFNNIMDMLQLVFGFVNAPLFAIFLLGMFWKRATGHGAFFGLLIGTTTAAIFHGNTLAVGETPSLLKGGWMSVSQTFASSMAQSFWMAILAFVGCFLGTLFISLATKPNRTNEELRGLVYSLTDKPKDDANAPWYTKPVALGVLVLTATLGLNLLFW